jgi:hypothetical protein
VVSILRQNLTLATCMQLAVELSWLVAAAMLAIGYGEGLDEPLRASLMPALIFAVLLVALNGAFGIYRRNEKLSSGTYVLRLFSRQRSASRSRT